jgi:hypothetical protein
MAPVDKFYMVARWMLPIYGALHLIPVALFKRREFLQNPMRIILRAGWGASRSSAFLGAFVFIYQCWLSSTLMRHLSHYLSFQSVLVLEA